VNYPWYSASPYYSAYPAYGGWNTPAYIFSSNRWRGGGGGHRGGGHRGGGH